MGEKIRRMMKFLATVIAIVGVAAGADIVDIVAAAVLIVVAVGIATFAGIAFEDKYEARSKKEKGEFLNNNEEKIKLLEEERGKVLELMDNELNKAEKENDNLRDRLHEITEELIEQRNEQNILRKMLKTTDEIQEYFSISKGQARISFILAIVNCVVGVVLLMGAVYFALTNPTIGPAIIAAVAGAVAETFAATSLIVHRKALSQLNHYHSALHEVHKCFYPLCILPVALARTNRMRCT